MVDPICVKNAKIDTITSNRILWRFRIVGNKSEVKIKNDGFNMADSKCKIIDRFVWNESSSLLFFYFSYQSSLLPNANQSIFVMSIRHFEFLYFYFMFKISVYQFVPRAPKLIYINLLFIILIYHFVFWGFVKLDFEFNNLKNPRILNFNIIMY